MILRDHLLSMAHAKEAVRRYAASLGRGWQIEAGSGARISKGEIIFVISEQEARVEPVREYVIARLETPGVVTVGPLSFKYADSFERGDLAATAGPDEELREDGIENEETERRGE